MKHGCICPIYRNAREAGGDPAIFSAANAVSYRELHSSVHQFHQKVRSLGVKAGDRVVIVSPNSIDYLVALFALWRCGAAACSLSPRLPLQALLAQMRAIGCKMLMTDTEKTIASDQADLRWITFPRIRTMPVPTKTSLDPGDSPAGYDLAQKVTVIFTSGSSGVPKAAVHSWGNHYYSALGANEHIPFGKGDRWLLSLPLYHVGGLGIVVRSFLGGGAVVMPKPKDDFLKVMVEKRVTHVSLVSTQLHRFLNDRNGVAVLRGLRAILVGGSAIPENLIRKALDAGIPLYISYGLTEMTSQVATSDRLSLQNSFLGARVLKYRQVRVSDETEILVKGETLFEGYLEGGRVHRPVDQDGWFATGDLGCLDGAGMLTVRGRKDSMFISGGENIQPEEIERYLCRIEGVLQAMVVPVKSEEFGSRPVAFIETEKGVQLSRGEIMSFLRVHLPSFKLPDQIYAWPLCAGQQGVKDGRFYFHHLAEKAASLQQIL